MPQILSYKIHLNVILHILFGLPNGRIAKGFSIRILHTFLVFRIRVTSPAHDNTLDFTSRIHGVFEYDFLSMTSVMT
jgi:hypothetical protein